MEECPAIYEMTCIMQDEIIPALLEEYPDELVQDDNGDINMEFNSLALLE